MNLSYNLLNFNVDSPEYEDSESFMKNLTNFFKLAKFINHVNFSGMNFQKGQILQLLEMMKNSEFLLAIHLSDNGITKDVDFYYECLDDFMITEDDLVEINRSKRKDAKAHPNESKKYDKLDIDYKGYLDQYFDLDTFKKHSTCKTSIRKLCKDRILLGKESKTVNQFKAMHEAQAFFGIGRSNDNMFDRFVLTR